MKRCGCGANHDAASWQRLEYVGDFEGLELRNCPCGSTISRAIDAEQPERTPTAPAPPEVSP